MSEKNLREIKEQVVKKPAHKKEESYKPKIWNERFGCGNISKNEKTKEKTEK